MHSNVMNNGKKCGGFVHLFWCCRYFRTHLLICYVSSCLSHSEKRRCMENIPMPLREDRRRRTFLSTVEKTVRMFY